MQKLDPYTNVFGLQWNAKCNHIIILSLTAVVQMVQHDVQFVNTLLSKL